MNTKLLSFEVKVGTFILIGMAILIIMIFSIGDIYFIRSGYNIKVTFNFANGIAMSAPVRLAGVEVGEIDNINIYYDGKEERTKVELSAWIKKDVSIEEDAKAVINTLGLLGEKYLEIFPGKAKSFLKDGNVIAGSDPVSVEDMTSQFKKLADAATLVMERLKDGEGTIGKFLTDDTIYDNLSEIMAKLNDGEGTIGKFLTDDTIYDNLSDFTADIKANPWKLMSAPKEKKSR